MEIIRERQRITNVTYELLYSDGKGGGYSFDCTEDGLLLPLTEGGLESFIKCITGEYDYEYEGIKEYRHSYTESAILECSCGEHVHLTSFTNTCDLCEADYNMSGQRLASRSQWGEETGEHWTDCY